MPQPITPQAVQEVATAFKIFMNEVRLLRLDKDQLVRDIITRIDNEHLSQAYDFIKSLIYERRQS